MEHLEAARILMGDSLGVHIIFALLGVGLPLFTSIIEYLSIRRKDPALRNTARLWSYISSVLVVAGVLSGTVVALQMFFVWPGIMQFGGSAISLGFMLEGYMFLIEAIFLAFYVRTWNSIKGYKHWLLSLPIIFGSTGSAVLITAVDAWMNHPTGMTVEAGKIISAEPMKALFNETTFYQATHSILAYYLTVALMLLGGYAWMVLRGKKPKVGTAKTTQYIMIRLGIASLVLLGCVAVLGDLSGKYLAKDEPTKLAAFELLDKTTANAPLVLGGTPNEHGGAEGGIKIPGMLSFLAGNNTNTVVQGLDSTPRELWPPLVVHTLFDIKLLLIGALTLIIVGFVTFYYKARKLVFGKPMLVALVAAPFISTALIELGWMMTEIGRQPYAVYGYLLTKDAITNSEGVLQLAWLFPTAYVALLIVTIWALIVTIKRFTPSVERSK